MRLGVTAILGAAVILSIPASARANRGSAQQAGLSEPRWQALKAAKAGGYRLHVLQRRRGQLVDRVVLMGEGHFKGDEKAKLGDAVVEKFSFQGAEGTASTGISDLLVDVTLAPMQALAKRVMGHGSTTHEQERRALLGQEIVELARSKASEAEIRATRRVFTDGVVISGDRLWELVAEERARGAAATAGSSRDFDFTPLEQG